MIKYSIAKKLISGVAVIYVMLILETTNTTVSDREYSEERRQTVMRFGSSVTTFRYEILPHLDKCAYRPPIIVATVLSTADRRETRDVIRQTWANVSNSRAIRDGQVLVYFIISSARTELARESVEEEAKLHGDVIMTDLPEGYGNLVTKVYAALGFHRLFCPQAHFHLKIDDDVILHVDRMMYYLNVTSGYSKGEKMLTTVGSTNDVQLGTRNGIYCKIWTKSKPKRDPTSKWYVPLSVWPGHLYPHYCNGPMYLMGAGAVQKILDQAATHQANILLEDVFYTGILAKRAGVPRRWWSKHILHEDKKLWSGTSACDSTGEPLVFSVHSLNTTLSLRQGYQVLQRLRCTISS